MYSMDQFSLRGRELFPLFKINVFRFIDKLEVYYRRHFLKAEQQSGHYVITIDQSGVFPKIASQLDYELK